MKLLIKINNPSSQLCEEALSLAFAMVAFEHEVQLWLGEDCYPLLFERNAKFGKMLASLHLYDIPPAWLTMASVPADTLQKQLDQLPDLAKQLTPLPARVNLAAFDSVMTF